MSKIKLKKLVKEWNDASFKNLPKRWSGAYGRKDCLTEFEAKGGKDIVAEDEGVSKFDKVSIPTSVNRYLTKFVQAMKDTNLNRVKRSAILYKVINASGLSTSQLMQDINKIKKELR